MYSHIVVRPAEDALVSDVAGGLGAEVRVAGTAPQAVGVPVAVVPHVQDVSVLDRLLTAQALVRALGEGRSISKEGGGEEGGGGGGVGGGGGGGGGLLRGFRKRKLMI